MYSSHSVANTQLETHQLIQPDEWVCALMLLLMREAACVSFPFITALDSQHHSASSPLSHSHGCKFTLLSLINTHAFALVDLHPALIVSNNITLATCVFPILIKNSSHIFRFFFWRLKILILLPIAHFCLTEQNAQMYKKKKDSSTHGWRSLRQRGWHCHCYPHSHCRRPHHQTPARKSTGRRLPPPQISSSVFHSWPAASAPETQRQQRGHTLFNIQFRAFIILSTLN